MHSVEDDQIIAGKDAPPKLMPLTKKNRTELVVIYLDDDDIPIVPIYSECTMAKGLQNIFRTYLTAHYSK
jgi:hypothetical protein